MKPRRVIYFLVSPKQWDSAFAHRDFDLEGMSPISRANIHFIRGKSALSDGDEESARQSLMALMELEDTEQVGTLLQHQLKADLLVLEGDLDAAVHLLRTAAEIEENRPLDYGPPMPAKPTYELLGEYYLKVKNGVDAAKAFQASLGRAPGRSSSLAGLIHAAKMMKDENLYAKVVTKLKKNWKHADSDVMEVLLVSDR